jgi:hypothetical protein
MHCDNRIICKLYSSRSSDIKFHDNDNYESRLILNLTFFRFLAGIVLSMQNMVSYMNLLKGGIWTMQFFIFRKFSGYRTWISIMVTFCLIVTLWPVGLFPTAEASNVEAPSPSKRELTAQRTATSKRFDNGDGSFTEQIYLQPIHRKQGNCWEEISAKLMQPTAGREIVTQQTELGIQFAPRMERGKYLTLQRGLHKLSYTFLAAEGDAVKTQPVNVTPTFAMNRIIHKNVVPGIHLRNIASDSSVKEDIVLENPHVFSPQPRMKAYRSMSSLTKIGISKGSEKNYVSIYGSSTPDRKLYGAALRTTLC